MEAKKVAASRPMSYRGRKGTSKGRGNKGENGGKKREEKKREAKVVTDSLDDYMTDSNGSSHSCSGVEEETLEKKPTTIMKKKRIFRFKESILTELSRDNKHFQSLYHAFIIMIITGIFHSLLKDTVEAGMPYVNVAYYNNAFGPADLQLVAVVIWIPLQVASLLVYPSFKLWMWLRTYLGMVCDVIFLVAFVLYNFIGHVVVVTCIVNLDLPPVPALVLSIEELRFTMKGISFVRENVYKVLHPWQQEDQSGPAVWYHGQMSPRVGTFSQYLYFLFAPTLLYRDHYPRIPRVRWLRVLAHCIKCAISVTFITILAKEIFGAEVNRTDSKEQLLTFLHCMLWGMILHFMAGYFFLHSWNNMFAELLRFADREFYSDWWTCTSFSDYYRKWNLLVHDWIKAYIYQDLKDLFHSKMYNKVAVFPTILISGLYHEYVLWAPMRFVMPVLVFQFSVFGALLTLLRPNPNKVGWNYFLHLSLHVGVSVMVYCYTTEFYARKICPMEENIINTFTPRFYTCYL